MRRWKPQEVLFVLTLPEARWNYAMPLEGIRRKRTWSKTA